MKKALIFNGKMVDLASEEFEIPNNMTWVDCPDSVEDFWEYDPDTGAFNNPIPVETAQNAYEAKIIELKNVRRKKQEVGITVNGIQVATDRESQALIIGARIVAKEAIDASESYVINWKADNGWVQLDAPTIIIISDLVREHIQTCFDVENTHDVQLMALRDADDISSLNNYDLSTGWPI